MTQNPTSGHIPWENHSSKDTCTPTSIETLFTLARTWKQTRCPLTVKWIKKLWYLYTMEHYSAMGFPGGMVAKNLPANAWDARDTVSIPRLGRFPGVGNYNTLLPSCLENSMDRGAWRATVHGIPESGLDTTEQVCTHIARPQKGRKLGRL